MVSCAQRMGLSTQSGRRAEDATCAADGKLKFPRVTAVPASAVVCKNSRRVRGGCAFMFSMAFAMEFDCTLTDTVRLSRRKRPAYALRKPALDPTRSRNDSIDLRSAGVSPAVFGVAPRTFGAMRAYDLVHCPSTRASRRDADWSDRDGSRSLFQVHRSRLGQRFVSHVQDEVRQLQRMASQKPERSLPQKRQMIRDVTATPSDCAFVYLVSGKP